MGGPCSTEVLGVDSPFFSTIVLSQNRLLERRIPGKNGNGRYPYTPWGKKRVGRRPKNARKLPPRGAAGPMERFISREEPRPEYVRRAALAYACTQAGTGFRQGGKLAAGCSVTRKMVGQSHWDPILGVGAPPILEPILLGIRMFTGGTGF